jgi:CRP/FNR family transcriptional regulator
MFINLVSSGYVKRYLITDDGEESIQVIYGPEDVFPLTPVFSASIQLEIYKGEEILYYEALTDVIMYSMEKSVFLEALARNPELYKDLFYVAGIRLESNIQRLENVSLRDAHQKVIDLLLFFARTFSSKTEQGTVLDVPLTHQTIASILNMARETVSHQMSQLQNQGLLFSQPHHTICIPDVSVLKTAR